MMKKHLLIALMSACAGNAYADAFNGSYAGVFAGYSYTAGDMQGWPTGMWPPISPNLHSIKKGGAYGAVFLGHGQTWGKTYLAGELIFSYDDSNPQLFSGGDGFGWTYRLSYRSQMGVGFAGIIGRFLMPQIVGFMRFGIDCSPSGSMYSSDTNGFWGDVSNKRMLNFVPGIGLKGILNDQFSWIFGVDYKFCFSSQTINFPWEHHPTSIIGKIGISYHF